MSRLLVRGANSQPPRDARERIACVMLVAVFLILFGLAPTLRALGVL